MKVFHRFFVDGELFERDAVATWHNDTASLFVPVILNRPVGSQLQIVATEYTTRIEINTRIRDIDHAGNCTSAFCDILEVNRHAI